MTDVMLAAPGIPGGLPALPNSTMRVQLHNGVKPPPSGFFRSLTGLALSWSLIEDGHVMDASTPPANAGKFRDPAITADGQPRATVPLSRPETLWFNTGTLCNITCANCYIESSPPTTRLVYITEAEVRDFLDQLETRRWPVREIGFTGGEPFMNPEMIAMARTALERGFEVLILTNAMRPMMRPHVQRGLARPCRLPGATASPCASRSTTGRSNITMPNAARARSRARSRAWHGCATPGCAWPSPGAAPGAKPMPRPARAIAAFTPNMVS